MLPVKIKTQFKEELTICRNPTAENCGAFLIASIKFLCASEYSSCLAFIIPVKRLTSMHFIKHHSVEEPNQNMLNIFYYGNIGKLIN